MVIDSLRRMLNHTRVLPGCIQCGVHSDVDEPNELLVIEEWSDMQALRSYLRSGQFRVILSSLEWTVSPPDVHFDVIATSLGMDLIRSCRNLTHTEG